MCTQRRARPCCMPTKGIQPCSSTEGWRSTCMAGPAASARSDSSASQPSSASRSTVSSAPVGIQHHSQFPQELYTPLTTVLIKVRARAHPCMLRKPIDQRYEMPVSSASDPDASSQACRVWSLQRACWETLACMQATGERGGPAWVQRKQAAQRRVRPRQQRQVIA